MILEEEKNNLVPNLYKIDYICQKLYDMQNKKDLYNLHCRIKHSTAEKLKELSDNLGYSMGEIVDMVVDGYEHFCNTQDEWLERTDIYGLLEKLNEKMDKIEKKVGAE